MPLEHVTEASFNSFMKKAKDERPVGSAYRPIDFLDDETCKAIIRRDSMAIRFVVHQTPALCQYAVEDNGLALQFVKNQTSDLCYSAMQYCHDATQYIRDDTMRQQCGLDRW